MAFSALALSLGVATVAQANGFGENHSWQFRSANDRIANANTLDLMERKRGGYYDSFSVNNHYTTNFAGDQINCYQTASTSGNTGTNLIDGVTSSPTTGTQGSGMEAITVGNEASTDVAGSNPPHSNDSVSNVESTSANQYANVGQSNSNSAQSSSLYDSAISSRVGSLDASGGRTEQALNSTQSNRDSVLTAGINDSIGCTFTGTGGDGGGVVYQPSSSVSNTGGVSH